MLRPHDDDWGDGDGCAGGDAEDPLVAGEDAAELPVAVYRHILDSGSQKLQRLCETHRILMPNKSLTTEVLRKNSMDLCMGRRPIYKSDEFF